MITVESYASSSWTSNVDETTAPPAGVWRRLPVTLKNYRPLRRCIAAVRWFLRILPPLCVWLAVSTVIFMGWWWRDELPLQADRGVGYALGILSAACMLLLLIYPLRKRVKLLRFLGATKIWFFIHMSLGVTAPIVALYHCGFKLGSLNSQIALLSILVVAASGLIGRFLYRHIYADWSGRRAAVRKLSRPRLFDTRDLKFLRLVGMRLAAFDKHTYASRRSLWPAIRHAFHVGPAARREHLALMRFCHKQLRQVARTNPLMAREKDRLTKLIDRYVLMRLMQAQQITRVQIYERLFALWHIVHLPFFILLLLSVIAHVLAVHLY